MADPDLTRRLRSSLPHYFRGDVGSRSLHDWRCIYCRRPKGPTVQPDQPCMSAPNLPDLRAAADRIDQLEQQLAALHTAIGNPENMRAMGEAYSNPVLRRIAAAVEHTQEQGEPT